jgi:hypothetical protein
MARVDNPVNELQFKISEVLQLWSVTFRRSSFIHLYYLMAGFVWFWSKKILRYAKTVKFHYIGISLICSKNWWLADRFLKMAYFEIIVVGLGSCCNFSYAISLKDSNHHFFWTLKTSAGSPNPDTLYISIQSSWHTRPTSLYSPYKKILIR